jgi:hypothetical protein
VEVIMLDERSLETTELSKEDLIGLVGLYLGELFVHYGLWFAETVRHHGTEKALGLEEEVLDQYVPRALQRLAPHFGIEMEGKLPRALAAKSKEDLLLLIGDIAKLWLAGDGLWFQAVESSMGMRDAKLVNDACWFHFALMEAFKIRRCLRIGPDQGLKGMEQALKLRIYCNVNAHSTSWEADGSLLFTMTECRVQSARRRKGLEDYDCKSGGIVEYSQFAAGIDPRIKAECVWCPPDRIPTDEFCKWRFRLEPKATE